MLHLKSNPYLLGDIRSTLDNRRRECFAKIDENSRSYNWHKNKIENEIYKRKMTPEEEIEHYKQSGFLRESMRLNKEYSEWDKLLKAFIKGSIYKNTKNIPMDNLEPNVIYDPDYSNSPIDPDFAEYWAVMVGNIDKFPLIAQKHC